jgi:hypothetical protein
MKITKQRLKQIIREELENALMSERRVDITRGGGPRADLAGRLKGRTRGIDPPEDEPVDVASDEYTPKQYEYDERTYKTVAPRHARLPDIPDEDLDPETGARKDLGRKAAGEAGDWGLGVVGGRSKDHKARVVAKHAAARAKRAAAEAAANPDNAPRLIPDEDLPPESRPRSLARKAVRAKMQANMAKKR